MAEKISLRDYQRELAERLRGGEGERSVSKLALRVGAENWMVDLGEAGEIIPVPRITPVPLTLAWFKGMTNVRGKLYSVVDFSAFLGGAPASITDQSRLLLIGERYRTGAALLVDRSLGLRNPAQLRGHVNGKRAQPWIRAEFTDEEGDSWKELDISKLVQSPDFLGVTA
ncbi:MAG TPA: chemotaxis protein CheW [Burkholderiales bacterium]|nr:chemotaxis protein CheW [Burkholderiales bacterium]